MLMFCYDSSLYVIVKSCQHVEFNGYTVQTIYMMHNAAADTEWNVLLEVVYFCSEIIVI